MGWPIRPDPDGVMAKDKKHGQPHQGGHPHRRALVICEGQIGHIDRNQPAMGGDPAGHGPHQMLAHPAMHVAALTVLRAKGRATAFVIGGGLQICAENAQLGQSGL